MRKIKLIAGCIISVSLFSSMSPVVAQGDTELKLTAEKKVTCKTLNDLTSWLDKTYTAYAKHITLNSADLYLDAHARIAVARPIFEKKPESEEARAAFAVCSLFTEAAILQLKARYNDYKISALNDSLKNTLEELTKVHETISYRERSKASRLKADLDAEKEKAKKLREEADKKFSELQSSLIQVSNDARGTIISMSDILFEVNKADLTGDLKTSLAKIAGILLVFKTSNIIVEGHTDNQGSEKYNQTLSEKRAENVMNFLDEQGVGSSRLTSVGYGFSKPIADNETKEGRQKNRRVDLIIQDNKKDE